MKKRKARRIESTVDIDLQINDINLQIDKVSSDSEKMKNEAVLNLIAKMITDIILKELYEDKDSLDEGY
ncbi:hypothetical protein CPT03_02320 [Pedobacter ginsengisoli]|uniref:Uncharacterized protein n=1 Tax=Pedobacter ginsengisoli TaxID=363852 RepID=A0A2D1U191_9SPHI|nr:hypothetical protein [Pedobacter ginsengisoli]ATP55381.1 hypothetical protein CPT03_02320 [Pedobacter ginsengisoli]